jgi:hypothetical protein
MKTKRSLSKLCELPKQVIHTKNKKKQSGKKSASIERRTKRCNPIELPNVPWLFPQG